MSSNRSGGETTEDWLSAPVGGGKSDGSTASSDAAPSNAGATGGGHGNRFGPKSSANGSSGRARGTRAGAAAAASNGSNPAYTGASVRTPAPAYAGDVATEQSRGSYYPTDFGDTGASSAALSPGPATSIGLGSSSATATSVTTAGATKTSGTRRPARGPRRAKLQIRHLDPWSTLKLSLVLAIAFFFVWMVAVGVLYGVLNGMGVFDKINSLFTEISSNADGGGGPLITTKVVFGGAALIGAINVVLFTALATVGSYIYNLCADLVGGLEITLAERR